MDYSEIRKILDDPEQKLAVCQQTQFLDQAYHQVPIRQRLWHLENGDLDIQTCVHCGTGQVNWNVRTNAYSRFCSRKCQAAHPDTQRRRSDTNQERYGVDHTFQSPDVADRIAKTNCERHGAANPFGSKVIQRKIRQTNLEKYGHTNPAKSQTVKNRIDFTHQKNYGVKRTSQGHIPQEILRLRDDREAMMELYLNQKMPVSEIAELMGLNHSQLCEHFKNNLNIDIHRHNVSQIERQIAEYLRQDLGLTVETSVRNLIPPKEIDIWLPELGLGIEVDGVAWHTENRGKNRLYHLHKKDSMNEQGYDLINITDLEWKTKTSIVKSRLKAKTNLADRVPGRKCHIVDLSGEQANEFFTNCHIQGNVPASVRVALQHDGDIVAAMSFGKARFRSDAQWELMRFANRLDTSVIGGASKLFRHFVRTHQPESIVSYCDRRWNTGTVYQQMGFEFQYNTEPNYWYTKNSEWWSRQKFQKHKLADLLEHYDPGLSEWQNMMRNGWDRYWDCGNSVWCWQNPGP